MAKLNFNATAAPVLEQSKVAFQALPAGTYQAQVVASAYKPTKSGNGHYLELQFEILGAPDPVYINRYLWSRLNLDNPNPVAVSIAERDLASILRAVGLEQISDSDNLLNRPLSLTVTQRPNLISGQMGNEIKAYAPAEAASKPTVARTPPWRTS